MAKSGVVRKNLRLTQANPANGVRVARQQRRDRSFGAAAVAEYVLSLQRAARSGGR